MENNLNHIPSHVFDLVQNRSFRELNATEKAEVLMHFSAEEYEEMHNAVREVKTMKQDNNPSSKYRIKQELLAEFDRLHPHPKEERRNLLFYNVPLWKVAAVFLLLTSASLWLINSKASDIEVVQVDRIDTVFVEKEVATPVKIYDTVYLVQRKKAESTLMQAPTATAHGGPAMDLLADTGFSESIIGIDDIDNAANSPKNNSMKYDSLLRRYEFVTL